MKYLIIIGSMAIFLLINAFAYAQTMTDHVRFDGGGAKLEYRGIVQLKAGWYEFVRDDGIFTYILYKRKEYRIMKSQSRVRSRRMMTYDNYYKL